MDSLCLKTSRSKGEKFSLLSITFCSISDEKGLAHNNDAAYGPLETEPKVHNKPEVIQTAQTINNDFAYGSLETNPKVRDKLEAIQEAQEAAAIVCDEEDKYSEAPSLLQHPGIVKYISSFAAELSASLPPDFDTDELESTLPSLLKAFAVRLGHESTLRIQRQIMYLVHRFRK